MKNLSEDEQLALLDKKIAIKRANIFNALQKSGFNVAGPSEKDKPSHQTKMDQVATTLQSLQDKLQLALDPHISESHKLTQVVNKSIENLQLKKKLAEDTMNTLTEIIQLRSSCQMVSKTLDQIEEAEGTDFDLLDNAIYFMSKSISIVKLLGVKEARGGEGLGTGGAVAASPATGVLKPSDIEVFERLKKRICKSLKHAMQAAIDLYNEDLEGEDAEGDEGEQRVRRIAHMFKMIDLQEEGMKFYTNFIMLGKHTTVSHQQASEQSITKQIENIMLSMYHDVEEAKQKIMENHETSTVKASQLLEEISFSQFYAEFQRVLIESIEDYGESIVDLFGLPSLVIFLEQIDKLSKEKGMQIIEHFLHNIDLDKSMQLVSEHDTFYHGRIGNSLALSQEQELEIDLLCEEICNFSYYFENYRVYVLNFLYKHMDHDLQSAPRREQFQKFQMRLNFTKIDEMMAVYVVLERSYLKNAIVKGFLTDNAEFITLVKNTLKTREQGGPEKPKELRSTSSMDGQTGNHSVIDLIDNISFIIDKCCKRALMSLSINNTCSLLNFVNELLSHDVLQLFKIRSLIFSGLMKQPRWGEELGKQLSGQLNKISHLFELSESCGLVSAQQGNLSNECLIQTWNRHFSFKQNIEQLFTILMEEFEGVITNDLKIGEEEEGEDEEHSDDSAPKGHHLHETQKKLMKEFGINMDVFLHTIATFKEAAATYEAELETQIGLVFREVEGVSASLKTLFCISFEKTNFNITNEQFEEYEEKELITADSLPKFNKMLRQWKAAANPQLLSTSFVQQLTFAVTDLVIEGLMCNQQKESLEDPGGISIMGGLFLEKAIRNIKQFILLLVQGANKQSFQQKQTQAKYNPQLLCERLVQVAQVLTSDTLEEAEELVMIAEHGANRQGGKGSEKLVLSLEEIRSVYALRSDGFQ